MIGAQKLQDLLTITHIETISSKSFHSNSTVFPYSIQYYGSYPVETIKVEYYLFVFFRVFQVCV